MRYKGKIEKLEHIVISDPTYDEDVSCRYERKNVNAKNWVVDIDINKVSDPINDEITIDGTEFFILLHPSNRVCELKEDGKISYLVGHKLNEFDIGIDTACVALGINEFADEIIESRDDWQPECALNTLSDGIFGCVREGLLGNQVNFICISGYLSDDTGYTIEDILDYLEYQLEILDLKHNYEKPYLLQEQKIMEKMTEIMKTFREITKEDENLIEYFKDDADKKFTSIKYAGTILSLINNRNHHIEIGDLEGEIKKSPFTEQQEKLIKQYTGLEKQMKDIEMQLDEGSDYDINLE